MAWKDGNIIEYSNPRDKHYKKRSCRTCKHYYRAGDRCGKTGMRIGELGSGTWKNCTHFKESRSYVKRQEEESLSSAEKYVGEIVNKAILVNDFVKSPKFGCGVVVEKTPASVVVAFGEGGNRKISFRMPAAVVEGRLKKATREEWELSCSKGFAAKKNENKQCVEKGLSDKGRRRPRGFAQFVESEAVCPVCSASMSAKRTGKGSRVALRCSECGKVERLSQGLVNVFFEKEKKSCPLCGACLSARYGRDGLRIKCEKNHIVSLGEIW